MAMCNGARARARWVLAVRTRQEEEVRPRRRWLQLKVDSDLTDAWAVRLELTVDGTATLDRAVIRLIDGGSVIEDFGRRLRGITRWTLGA